MLISNMSGVCVCMFISRLAGNNLFNKILNTQLIIRFILKNKNTFLKQTLKHTTSSIFTCSSPPPKKKKKKTK